MQVLQKAAHAEMMRPAAKRAPTQEDVAFAAGVSTATVSRVLNGSSLVRSDMRSRVEGAIRELGYLPHGAARTLAMNRSFTIGAVIPTLNNEIFAATINELEKALGNGGYTLLLSISNFDPEVEAVQVRRLIERGIDGLVLVGNDHAPGTHQIISATGVRVVTVLSYDEASAYPNVGFKNREASGAAVAHLVKLGHRDIGMVAGLTANNDRARERLIGVQEAVARHGLDLSESYVIEAAYTLEAGREALSSFIARGALPTAVICGNDVLGLGVLIEAQARHIRVPGELSIVGFDNLPLTRHFQPSLTTIAVPVAEAGRIAGAALIDAVKNNNPIQHIMLKAPLLVRGSTAPPRIGKAPK